MSKRAIKLTIMSFGYKHQPPPDDAQFVLDVRQLVNPFWVDELKPLCGLDKPVQDYVLKQDMAHFMLEHMVDWIRVSVPDFQHRHGDHTADTTYVVAVGCTGGRHRSVAMAEAIAHKCRGQLPKHITVTVVHRDIDKD